MRCFSLPWDQYCSLPISRKKKKLSASTWSTVNCLMLEQIEKKKQREIKTVKCITYTKVLEKYIHYFVFTLKLNDIVNSLKNFFFSSNSLFFNISLIVHLDVLLTILEPLVANNKYYMLIQFQIQHSMHWNLVFCGSQSLLLNFPLTFLCRVSPQGSTEA